MGGSGYVVRVKVVYKLEFGHMKRLLLCLFLAAIIPSVACGQTPTPDPIGGGGPVISDPCRETLLLITASETALESQNIAITALEAEILAAKASAEVFHSSFIAASQMVPVDGARVMQLYNAWVSVLAHVTELESRLAYARHVKFWIGTMLAVYRQLYADNC